MREAIRRSEPRRQALHVIHMQPPRLATADQRPDQLGRQAKTRRPLAPLGRELLGRDAVVLPPPSLERRDLRRRGGPRPMPLQLGIDLRPPPTERPQHRSRHAGHVGDPVPNRTPLEPELARQLGAQPSLVEVAGGLGVRIQPPPVERRPAAVGAEREVGDQDVRVQLRVAGPRRPMPERRRDQPTPGHGMNATGTTPRHRGMPLDVAERIRNGAIVRAPDRTTHPIVTNAEQHAHALRSRERQVEARHATLRAPPEQLPGPRMRAVEDPPQRIVADLAVEAQQPRGRTHPDAARLRPAQVVVLDTRADRLSARHVPLRLLEVVVGLAAREFADRKHRHRPSR